MKVLPPYMSKKINLIDYGNFNPSKKFELPKALPYKINLPPNVNPRLKNGEINLVNIVRTVSAYFWEQNTENEIKKIRSKYSIFTKSNFDFLRNIIASFVKYDISSNNRFLPPPINNIVLERTLGKYFIDNRQQLISTTEKHAKEINEKYSTALIDYHIIKIFNDESYSKIKVYDISGDLINKEKNGYKDIKNNEGVWVRIPSRRNDKQHPDRNVSVLEALSSNNWCTRSRFDQAENMLREGDFFIFLKKQDGKFIPAIGMPSKKGVITQIQGQNNDGYIPIEYFDIITRFIKKNNFSLLKDYGQEGLSAEFQLAVCEKLMEERQGISLQRAIETSNKSLIEDILLEGEKIDKKTCEDFICIKNMKGNYNVRLIDFGLTDEKIASLL